MTVAPERSRMEWRTRPIYLLVPSVFIPPRLNFRTEFGTTVKQALADLRANFRSIQGPGGKGPKRRPL
jgi:hypothetical protein